MTRTTVIDSEAFADFPDDACEILDIADVPAFCISAQGRIVCVNRQAAGTPEMARRRYLGRHARTIDPRVADWPKLYALLEREGRCRLQPVMEATDPRLASRVIEIRPWALAGQALAVLTIREQGDPAGRQEAMGRRDAILQAVSSAASRYLADIDWDDACNALLRDLGEATRVSRVYIFQTDYADDGQVLFSQKYEWVAPGILPQIDNPELQNLPMEEAGYGRWVNLLSRGRLVAGQVKDFPESEQELLESQAIISIAVVPVFTGNQWWGMMGFDECDAPREWSVSETEALRTVAGLYGLALERREASRLAREKRDSMAHEARLIAMGEMASSIAHEINQPLSAVSNYCETGLSLLQEGKADGEILLRAFRGAASQARRASEIIRRLREFLSKGDTTRSDVDLPQLVRETLGLVAHDARARGIAIESEMEEDLPVVHVCRVQIQQVLFNLVRNGIEAMEELPPGSPRRLGVFVTLSGSHMLSVTVTDTGPGVRRKDAALIFEPFETTKSGGMGLGLSISRSIMEAHGGILNLDLDHPGGACFRVTLPCGQADD